MPFLPWRFFHSWSCLMCGECCEKFNVSLTPSEALLLVKGYGEEVVERKGGKVYLKRVGGRCIFQDGRACSIQSVKPSACKLWPFKVSSYPLRLEDKHLAEYDFAGLKLYVYLNTFCRGLNKGTPIWMVIPEAVAIHLGLTDKQAFTTSLTEASELKPIMIKKAKK
ncbi:MAG: YkgJ family cysteine cluster protein [Candidatus Jordarchaeales archaeon]